MNEIKLGKYRHFKGNEYEVIGIASHSETMEPMVVYQALYGEHGIWVRPAAMFCEEITRDGKTFKRFEKMDLIVFLPAKNTMAATIKKFMITYWISINTAPYLEMICRAKASAMLLAFALTSLTVFSRSASIDLR